jgi:transcriptional regulator with XRE-family HTH domain
MASTRRLETVLEEYVADDLGAPFKVLLVNSVRQISDTKTGEIEQIIIPNLRGLLHQIALTRVLVSRKLSGPDIKFLRKAMPIKALELAGRIGVSPEHLSRCEAGERALSVGTEKCLRVAILLERLKLPECVGDLCEQNDFLKQKVDAFTKAIAKIQTIINNMRIQAAHDPHDELCLSFTVVANQENFFKEDDADWAGDHPLVPQAA